MKKYLFLLLCAAIASAASCEVRINGNGPDGQNNNPTTPTSVVPIINSFTTDNAFITLQQSTTLRWSASGVCRIEPTVGDVPNSGNTPITPTFTTTYTLSCSASGTAVVRTVTITVR